MFMSVNVSVFVNVNEFGHRVCGESWHATKALQPTAPVLKAGHPVSYSCCLFVCFMGWEFLRFLSPPFCLLASVLYTYNYMYICTLNIHSHLWALLGAL